MTLIIGSHLQDKQIRHFSKHNSLLVYLISYLHLGQNVHSLQHSLHLPLLLRCELVQQRLQMACLQSNTQNIELFNISFQSHYDQGNPTNYISVWQAEWGLGELG